MITIFSFLSEIFTWHLAPESKLSRTWIQSRCDATDDVSVFKMALFYIICNLVCMTEVKLKISCANYKLWKISKTVPKFDLGDFWNQSQMRNLSMSERLPVSRRLWQYLFLRCTIKTDQVMLILIWPILWLGDVTDDVMVCDRQLAQLDIPTIFPKKKCLCRHQSFNWIIRTNIVINTHTHTDKLTNTAWKHSHLAIAGDNKASDHE